VSADTGLQRLGEMFGEAAQCIGAVGGSLQAMYMPCMPCHDAEGAVATAFHVSSSHLHPPLCYSLLKGLAPPVCEAMIRMIDMTDWEEEADAAASYSPAGGAASSSYYLRGRGALTCMHPFMFPYGL
jgi:hypothetical protein